MDCCFSELWNSEGVNDWVHQGVDEVKELEEIKYIEGNGEVCFESHHIVNDKRHPGHQGDYRQYK